MHISHYTLLSLSYQVQSLPVNFSEHVNYRCYDSYIVRLSEFRSKKKLVKNKINQKQGHENHIEIV